MAPFEPIKTPNAPAGLSDVYSQAVRVDKTIYLSGCIPRDMDGNIVQGTVEDRARQVIKSGVAHSALGLNLRCKLDEQNLEGVLSGAGLTLHHVVKATIYLTDLSKDFAAVNEVWKELTPDPKPARTCIGVKELPSQALGTDVEMEFVAYDDRES